MTETQLAPGWLVVVEEATESHWVGAYGNVVVVVLQHSSHDDPSHVHAMSRLVRRLRREGAARLHLLVLFPPGLGRPPSAEVRAAIVEASADAAAHLDRAAAVVLGTGFLAAIHRGALTGLLSVMRLSIPFVVTQSPGDAMRFLIGDQPQVHDSFSRFCRDRIEARGSGPDRAQE